MTQKEMLLQARAKIEAGWCQYNEAKDENGSPVASFSAEAVSFCILGAAHGEALPPLRTALRARLGLPEWVRVSLADYNDAKGRTQAEVLSLFDEAIALAEKGE